MSGLVLDCSVTLTWCFDDEASADGDAVLEWVRDEGALVPALWHLEVANVLVQAERRKRLTSTETAAFFALVAQLPILIDDETARRAWRGIVDIARTEGLSAYDAAYLELAIRRALPLATKDRALSDAAARLGVVRVPV